MTVLDSASSNIRVDDSDKLLSLEEQLTLKGSGGELLGKRGELVDVILFRILIGGAVLVLELSCLVYLILHKQYLLNLWLRTL